MKKILFIFLLVALMMLSACTDKETVAQDMRKDIEKMSTIEKEIVELQNPTIDFERLERSLLDEALKLPNDKFEEKRKKMEEAIFNAEKRLFIYQEQEKKIEEKLEIAKVMTQKVGKIKDEKIQTTSKDMVTVVGERVRYIQEANRIYQEVTKKEIKFYEEFGKEGVSSEVLTKMFEEIKKAYDEVAKKQLSYIEGEKEYIQKRNLFLSEAGYKVEQIPNID